MPDQAARRDALRRIERALGREMHQLTLSPKDAWQQLFNWLRWQAEPRICPGAALDDELVRRIDKPPRPAPRSWVRRQESTALVATLPFPDEPIRYMPSRARPRRRRPAPHLSLPRRRLTVAARRVSSVGY